MHGMILLYIICSCSFRWPWPWGKVTVAWQRKPFKAELSRLSKHALLNSVSHVLDFENIFMARPSSFSPPPPPPSSSSSFQFVPFCIFIFVSVCVWISVSGVCSLQCWRLLSAQCTDIDPVSALHAVCLSPFAHTARLIGLRNSSLPQICFCFLIKQRYNEFLITPMNCFFPWS